MGRGRGTGQRQTCRQVEEGVERWRGGGGSGRVGNRKKESSKKRKLKVKDVLSLPNPPNPAQLPSRPATVAKALAIRS